MKTLILRENSSEIRSKLTNAGISCCTCCSFWDSVWLDYKHSITHEVHGIGYSDNGIPVEEAVKLFVAGCKDPYYCEDVEEFIAKINEQQNLNTKK